MLFLDIMKNGGPVMWIIALFAVIALAITPRALVSSAPRPDQG